MKNLEALKQKHKELGEEIARLESPQEIALDFYKVRVPNNGETYWTCCTDYTIGWYYWDNDYFDRSRWNAGIIFNTKEQAESYSRTYGKLKKILGDFEPETGKGYWGIFWEKDHWSVFQYPANDLGFMPFPTEAAAQRAIDEIGMGLHWFHRRRML